MPTSLRYDLLSRREVEELKIGQLLLHFSEATVKAHFYRARPLLRKALSEAHMARETDRHH
jgi:hypothetical protein